jgi:hypothetical protein
MRSTNQRCLSDLPVLAFLSAINYLKFLVATLSKQRDVRAQHVACYTIQRFTNHTRLEKCAAVLFN